MENSKANHFFWARSVVAALLVLLSAGYGLPAQAEAIAIAAIVGDTAITTTDVNERRDLIMATAGIPATVENQQKVTPRILQSLIDESLQLQEAKRQSITVTDEEVSKAIDDLGQRSERRESVRAFIARNGLSMRSMENQIRAQLAWGKVVQRKLKRNVTVSQDEVQRAQRAAASTPGEEELRIAVLELKMTGKGKDEATQKLAEDMALQLKAGTDMATVAARYIKQPEVRFNPPLWVAESTLPPALQQTLHRLNAGDVTPPLRGPTAIQLIQVLDRKTAPKLSNATEYAIKQIAIAVPKKRDKASLAKLRSVASALRTNPGECTSESIPQVDLPTQAKFIRTRLGDLSPQQRSVVTHLEVGQVSEPLMAPDALRLVMLCEKVEPSTGDLPDADAIRQQLYGEKLELEAQKHMRNLRRDAFIDMKGAP